MRNIAAARQYVARYSCELSCLAMLRVSYRIKRLALVACKIGGDHIISK